MQDDLSELLIKTFWEDLGPIIRPSKLNEKIIHYTSLEGLMGILSSNEVWMTKSDFLNDTTEIIYFKTLKEEAILKFKEIIHEKYNSELLNKNNLLDIFIGLFNKSVTIRFENPIDNIEVYVMSLSENDDSLTLWGNYAKGNGYNISFDTSSLLKEVNDIENFTVVYGKVLYDREEQLIALSKSLVKAFDTILDYKPEIEILEKDLLSYFKSLIISYSIFFKYHSFKHEEEFRIALTTRNDKAEVFFRSNGEVIIPYIVVGFDKDDVKEIVIGPKNNSDIAENGVKIYLERKNYNLEEITVKKSKVPLRY